MSDLNSAIGGVIELPGGTKAVIRPCWQTYAKMVLPSDAGAVQRSETEMAFYAGADTIFQLLTIGMSEGDEVTARDLATMNGIAEELTAFRLEKLRQLQTILGTKGAGGVEA